MDNFRKSKPINNSGSADGMLRRRMRHSQSSDRPSTLYKPGSSSLSTSQEARIGNFSRKEGFLARKPKSNLPDGRSLGRDSGKAKQRPIDMKIDETTRKERRFGRKGGRKPRNWKKLALRGSLGLMVLLIIVGGYLGAKGYLRARQVFKGGGNAVALDGDIDPSQLKGEGDGRVNILLLGKGGPEQPDGPDLTDTIIVASIDPVNKEAGLLSIPRDLAVKMDSGETTKINAVYALTKMSAKSHNKSDADAEKAGLDAIQKTVKDITGLPIHYYTMVDFAAFQQAVNTVGGVDVDVKTAVSEHMLINNKPYYLNVPVGNQHFDGIRALAYSRSRYTSARGDFDRSERQRQIIVALKSKVFSVGTFSNPAKISQLIDTFGSRVQTNLSLGEITKLYNLGQKIDSAKIQSVSLVDEPNVLIVGQNSPSLGSIQVPAEGLYRYGEIRSFVRNTLKDGFIKKENPGLVVLNGTNTAGLATTQSNILKSYGYNVVQTGDAPDKNVTNTILVDLKKSDKKYTKRYLELRYKTTATTSLPAGITPPENADFVIIVGQNETTTR